MVKKNKNIKNKTKITIIVIGITIILLFLILLIGVSIISDTQDLSNTQGNIEEQSNEYYVIESNATDYQKELYEKLSEQLNNEPNKVEIAKTVVQSFVADFYTWTNKDGSYDVGGLEYIYASSLTNFNLAAREYFYNQLSTYIDDYGKENLLEVTDVRVSGDYAPTSFVRDDVNLSTFYIEASWDYKDSTVFDSSDYQKIAYFNVVINESGRFEIVNFIEG